VAIQWHCRGHRFDPGWLHHYHKGLVNDHRALSISVDHRPEDRHGCAEPQIVSSQPGPLATSDVPCGHHPARGQTLTRCLRQYRQRHIRAYQPAPNSSKLSCGVSCPQSRQKRRNRAGWSRNRISLCHPSFESADRSPSAANMARQRLRRVPPIGPVRRCGDVRPTRSRILSRVNGSAERAIIASPTRHRERGINHAIRIRPGY